MSEFRIWEPEGDGGVVVRSVLLCGHVVVVAVFLRVCIWVRICFEELCLKNLAFCAASNPV